MSWIGENVIGFTAFLNHGYLTWWKLLKLLPLSGGFGSDQFKAGGRQHALPALRAGLCGAAADEQQYRASGCHTAQEHTRCWFHKSDLAVGTGLIEFCYLCSETSIRLYGYMFDALIAK